MSKYPGRIVTDLAPAGYSVAFNGSSYLSVANNAALDLGSGDFTIEGWWYFNDTSNQSMVSKYSGGAGYVVQQHGSTLRIVLGIGGSDAVSTFAWTPVAGVWYHVAITRSGTNGRAFVNGTQVGTIVTLSTSNTAASVALTLGFTQTTSEFTRGNLSNFRFTKGTALYTSNFNVPTQLFPVTNTQLLTCQSPSFVDNSTNTFPVTVGGGTPIASTFTPFPAYVPYNPALGASTPGVWTVDEAMQAAATRQWNMYDPYFNLTTLLLHGNPTNGTTWLTDASTNRFTLTPNGDARAAGFTPFSTTSFATAGSGYFDGTGDWVSAAANAAFQLGTGDWTVEYFVFATTFANSPTMVDTRATTGGNGYADYINTSGKYLLFWSNTNQYTSTATLVINTWYHIAVCRASGTVSVYINGNRDGTFSSSTNLSDSNLRLGNNEGGSGGLTGYLSSVRIVKGTAVYSGSTITVPTAPLTAITNTSLLTLQNSQSANNNAFLDSSSNNFLITRNGNTTQGTFSPFSQTGWSNYFDGSGDSLVTPANSAFDPSGQNVTVDFFVYFTRYASANNIVFEVGNSSVGDLQCNIVNTGEVRFTTGGNTGSTISGFTLNTWHYITCVKSGTNLTVYLNAVAGTTVSLTPNSKTTMYIGAQSGGNTIDGYISNFRYVRGSANIPTSIPTAPLTNITNTSLLTCQSNRFVDNGTANSGSGFALTVNGNVSVQAFSPFLPTRAYTPQTIGGSGYFDGTGDFLSIPTNPAFIMGTGDFTLEAWINPNSISTGTFDRVCATSDFNGSGFDWTLNTNSSALYLASVPYSFSVNTRTWSHIVYTRSGTTLRGFLNGRLASYNTGASQNITSTGALLVGAGYSGTGYNGYMTDLRIIKGSIPTAYQTSSTTTGTQIFTPPAAPLTTTSQGATAGNISCLLNYTNAGVVDSTGDNVLETVGNASISTVQSRFGGSSILFDGSGDYLIPNAAGSNALYALGTGDFTIETWVYPTSFTGQTNVNTIFDFRPASTNGIYPTLFLTLTNGYLTYFVNNSNVITTTSTPTLNTWSHVALVRSSGSTRLYLNGTQVGSTYTDTNNYLGSASRPSIGTSGFFVVSDFFTGYMDDFRITRFARYTGNFTPQTSQWQDQ